MINELSKLFTCATCRPGVVKAVEEFKLSVYGDNYDEEGDVKVSEASRKRKAATENAAKECANYDWADLADKGKVRLNVAFTYFHLKVLFSALCMRVLFCVWEDNLRDIFNFQYQRLYSFANKCNLRFQWEQMGWEFKHLISSGNQNEDILAILAHFYLESYAQYDNQRDAYQSM